MQFLIFLKQIKQTSIQIKILLQNISLEFCSLFKCSLFIIQKNFLFFS